VELRRKLRQYKIGRGLIGYDDMLERMRDALIVRTDVIERIRGRFTYAIVDEFQDTDGVQWDIFRRIFFMGKENGLIVVGDPKQAIYSFRGADVFAYKDARNTIHSRDGEHSEDILNVNYRSSPELIACLNALFEDPIWFGSEYPPAIAAAFEDQKAKIVSAPEGKPLTFVDLTTARGAPHARTMFADFIASEILRVIDRVSIQPRDSTNAKAVSFRDFCVLIRGRNESRYVERAFRARGIPHSYYKKPGVYQSAEALEWVLMLRATESLNPFDIRKAMLGRFLGYTLQDLLNLEEAPPAIVELFREWNALAMRRRWARLFREMMIRTPVLLPEDAIGLAEGTVELDPSDPYERRRTNLEQIAQDVEIAARERRMDLHEIIQFIQSRRSEQVFAQEDADLHRDESENDRVRIMTMHASKGLEFPFVFIAGGYGEALNESFREFHTTGDTRLRVFDLEKSRVPEAEIEKLEEQKRLYYVAFTRAELRVYAPFYRGKTRPGPLTKFVFPAAERIIAAGRATLTQVLRAEPRPIPEIMSPDVTGTIEIKEYPSLGLRGVGLTSYSGIVRIVKSLETSPHSFGEFTRQDEPETVGGAPLALPRGARTGDAIHSMLEELSFSEFDLEVCPDTSSISPASARIIEDCLTRHGFDSSVFFGPAADLIWRTLNTEMPGVGRLASVRDRIPEMRFLLSVPGSEVDGKWEKMILREGFVQGAMDLVFRHNDKYFVLDWKTNTLDDYSAENIARAIRRDHYDLQYQIYSHALLYWLRQFAEFRDDDFGGVFYLYLRGLKPGSHEGIFFARPSIEELSDFGAIVKNAFKSTTGVTD